MARASVPCGVWRGVAAAVLAAASAACAQPGLPAELMARIDAGRVRASVDRLAGFGTRHSLSETGSETRGIGAARRWIKAELESAGGGTRVAFEEFDLPPSARVPKGGLFVNVVATIPGSAEWAANRRYYVVAHYDSMPTDVMDAASDAPGANDNASGTAAAMEIARVIAQRPLESTVVVLLTAGEEQGLLGARAHAEGAASRKEEVRGVLNNDIIGDPLGPGGDPARSTRGLVRVLSEGLPRALPAERLAQVRQLSSESDGASRQLARFVAEVARVERTAVRPMLVFRPDRFLRGGDHLPFNDAGFAAVRFCEVHEDYTRQHQNVRTETVDGRTVEFGDTPRHVDAEYVADVARLNLAALVHMAMAPSVPADVRVVTARLETTTTLRWTRSPEPDVAGYEVVWRLTTEPEWTRVKDVGDASEVTIDESKDNFFFGVRAYDKEGYRSPVGFAGAARQ